MTKTEAKRAAFPERYAKKDARNAVYRAVYGQTQLGHKHDRPNDPTIDPFRDMPREFSHSAAKQVVDDLMDLAQFPIQRQWVIEARLNDLAKYRKGGPK